MYFFAFTRLHFKSLLIAGRNTEFQQLSKTDSLKLPQKINSLKFRSHRHMRTHFVAWARALTRTMNTEIKSRLFISIAARKNRFILRFWLLTCSFYFENRFISNFEHFLLLQKIILADVRSYKHGKAVKIEKIMFLHRNFFRNMQASSVPKLAAHA